MKLSYLGINNTFRDAAITAGDHTVDPSIVNKVEFADDALRDWAAHFPHDPQLARTYFLAINIHRKIWLKPNQEKAWTYINRMTTQFPTTYFGKLIKRDIAIGFTEHYYAEAVPCPTPVPTPIPTPEPTLRATAPAAPSAAPRNRPARTKATPTPRPTPTPTVAPTATPSPEPTPAPAPTPQVLAKGLKVQIETPACIPPPTPGPARTPVLSPAPSPASPAPSPQPAATAVSPLPTPKVRP